MRDVLQLPSSSRKWQAFTSPTKNNPKEKTRSFKGDDGVSYVFRDGDWVLGSLI